MGLKSGSRDSGLEDENEKPTEEEDSTATETVEQTTAEGTSDCASDEEQNPSPEVKTGEHPEADVTSETTPASRDESPKSPAETPESEPEEDSQPDSSDTPDASAIPYKLRRSQVNEGREQVPFFLRPNVMEGEEKLRATLEAELGETVYKSDYREAAMIVAQEHPDMIAAVLREWGYDF